MDIRIAIDTLSGKYGLEVTLPAIIKALQRNDQVRFLLYGPLKKIAHAIEDLPEDQLERVVVANAPNSSLIDSKSDQPGDHAQASLLLAIDALKSGRADALVTACHIQDLIPICQSRLDLYSEVSKPAMMRLLPALKKPAYILDVGAHLYPSAQELLEFALMGSEALRVIAGKRYPRIGLLSNASSAKFTTERIRETDALIRRTTLNYAGLVEGYALFDGSVDLILCDGWTGNISIKSAQGAVVSFMDYLIEQFSDSAVSRSLSLPILPFLRRLQSKLNQDPQRYGGALVLGYDHEVIKCHTQASSDDFTLAIDTAIKTANFELSKKIHKGLDTYHTRWPQPHNAQLQDEPTASPNLT